MSPAASGGVGGAMGGATACAPYAASSDSCLTQAQWTEQLIALLPRGRAWGTHDGGPFPGSVLHAFWFTVAGVLAWFEVAACALILEFFCGSTVTNRDGWMADYNLPDGCDPYPDLCSKVAAVGSARCDYYRDIAAQAGWSITCADVTDACGSRAGRSRAGCNKTGRGLGKGRLYVAVSLSASPAYVGGASAALPSYAGRVLPLAGRMRAGRRLACPSPPPSGRPFAGALRAGRRLGCPPDISGLKCLLARVVGAHVLVIYGIDP